ncbi:MAG: ABC transporter permease subunit [Verrucomicrobiota bacterium]|jgi:ABC-type transport system involved in multi-copper enzyme maturation permease subunit
MNVILCLAAIVIKELYRRKDFYVLFVITAVITLMMGSVSFFHEANIVRYVKDICLLLIWISSLVIAIVTTARQIPAERESRTIFPLLAKPVTRGQVVVGKFAGCWLACGLALVVFYLFFGLVSAAKEGHLPLGQYLQAFWLHWATLAVVISMALLGSLVFSAPSANATICFTAVVAIFILGGYLHKLAALQPPLIALLLLLLYFLIPHLEWFYTLRERLVFDHSLIGWDDCLLATAYLAAYAAAFLFAAWLVFRRKTLTT